ncbi:MAG: corrinoid protein [Anaerolineae bacterium]|nr:corrinoid protein [Anaerolineae bacterium]
MNKALLAAMAQSVLDGEIDDARALAQQALDQGVTPLEAINHGFVRGLDEVGEEYACGDLFLPDLVAAAEAMKAALAVLEPALQAQGSTWNMLGKVVIGTIQGDIHDIGKTLVGTMLSANGFQVYDLGVNVAPEAFAAKVREVGADLVGVSALLTTTMIRQKDVIEALEDVGLRPGVKVMVGGAPVTTEWAEQIGADGFSEDAIGAVALARSLVAAGQEQR